MNLSRSLLALGAALLIGGAFFGVALMQGDPQAPVVGPDPLGPSAPDGAASLVDDVDETLPRSLFGIETLPHLGGRVVTTTGAAVEGARVTIPGVGSRRSGTDGEFLFEALLPGIHVPTASFAGHIALPSPPVRIGADSVDDLRLVLEPARTLQGTVRAQVGTPLEGASIQVVLRSAERVPRYEVVPDGSVLLEVVTQADGRFAVGPLPTGRVDLVVRRAGFTSFGRTYATDSPPITVTLEPTSGVHGRVVSAQTGEPLTVSRATLIVPTRDAEGPWKVMDDPSGRSDAGSPDGEFRLHPRTRRPMRVVVEGPDFVRVVSEVFRLDGTNDHGPLELVADTGPRLVGRVQDDLGAPVPDAEIWIEEMRGVDELVQTGAPFRTVGVRSDSAGRFLTEPLGTSTYVLHAAAAGHRPAQVDVRPDSPVPTLVLSRAGSLAGLVRTPGGGVLPATWARVRTAAADPFPVPPVAVVGGRFRIEGLPLGTHTVELHGVDPGRRQDVAPRSTSEVHLTATEVATVVLDLRGLGSLFGDVLVDGVGVPFCEVSLTGIESDLVARCITDARGGFAIGGLDPGGAWLAVRTAADLEPHTRLRVEIPGSGALQQDLLVRTGRVSGRVVDAEAGRPLAGVKVRLEVRSESVDEPRLLAELSTDADGRWEHAELPSGEILVSPLQRFRTGTTQVPCEVLAGGNVVAPELVLTNSGQLELLVRTEGRLKTEIEVVVRPLHETRILTTQRRVGAGRMKLGEFVPGMVQVQVTNLADGTQVETTASVRERWVETVVVDL